MSEEPVPFPPVEKMADIGTAGPLLKDRLAMLAAASEAHQPMGNWGHEYAVIKAVFDPLFYLSQYPDIRDKELDPVGHYLRAGARENRDPAPWFSTREYRDAYLSGADGELHAKTNPLYHYLTVGRAAGHATRAPTNYNAFCASLGMSTAQTSNLVAERMKDVRDRLCHGALGRMVLKAADLDPMIHAGWSAGLRVRVPPASNEKSVARIGHMLDLQAQAKGRRCRAVIVISIDETVADVQSMIDQIVRDVTAPETVIVYTNGNPAVLQVNSAVRLVEFSKMAPQAKNAQTDRTLIEFIRSLRPDIVINMNTGLMNRALRVLGRALAASCTVYQYLPFDGVCTKDRAQLGRRYYRAIDQQLRVIVPTECARDYLAQTFALPDQDRSAIWTVECGAGASGPRMVGAGDV